MPSEVYIAINDADDLFKVCHDQAEAEAQLEEWINEGTAPDDLRVFKASELKFEHDIKAHVILKGAV